jgi:hypothetical protein
MSALRSGLLKGHVWITVARADASGTGLVPQAGIVGKARPINEKAIQDQELSTPRLIPKKTE